MVNYIEGTILIFLLQILNYKYTYKTQTTTKKDIQM